MREGGEAARNFCIVGTVIRWLLLLRLIHMYPATESGGSESEPFALDDYFL